MKNLPSWYVAFQKFLKNKQCPYEVGFEIVLSEYPLDASALILPPEWSGRWRFTAQGSLGRHPGYYECYQFYADIYD